MVWQLRKCVKCNNYTLNMTACPKCNSAVKISHPAKFSPDDKYLKYRMAMKKGSEQQ